MYICVDELENFFINKELRGKDNLVSLISSMVEYECPENDEPVHRDYEAFCTERFIPAIALGIEEMDDCHLVLDMIVDGTRREMYVDEDVEDYIWDIQNDFFNNLNTEWTEEEIHQYAFVKSEIFMIYVEDNVIVGMYRINQTLAYHLVNECISVIANSLKAELSE